MVRAAAFLLALGLRLLPALQSPTLGALYPNAAPPSVSLPAVIHGSNLAKASLVTFSGGSGVSATITAGGTATDLPVTISVAPGTASGPRTMFVTTPSGTAQAANVFLVVGPSDLRPQINPLTAPTPGLSVSVAPYYGAQFFLTVTGQYFGPDATVFAVDTQLLTTYIDATRLLAVVPTATVLSVRGTQDIHIRQKQNAGSANIVRSNAMPMKVVARGDIDASNAIDLTDATSVALNVGILGNEAPLQVRASDFNVDGNVDISDALALGLFFNGKAFNLATPTITSVSPSPANAGQPLAIIGTGFAPTSSDMEVSFSASDGTTVRVGVALDPALPGQRQSTSLQVMVPNNAVSGPIQIYRLDSPAGSQPFVLSVNGSTVPLLLTEVSPVQAAVDTSIILKGTGFLNSSIDNRVLFAASSGTVRGTITNVSAGSLTVMVPTGAICGPVKVETWPLDDVQTGTSNSKPFSIGTCTGAPVLAGLWGASVGGKVLVLEGTGFEVLKPQDNVVTFTGAAQPAPVLQSGATALHVLIPIDAVSGPVTVARASGGGTSNPINFRLTDVSITSITSNNGSTGQTSPSVVQGQVVPVTILGTGFISGGATAIDSIPGISVTALTFVNSTRLTATFNIASNAALGTRPVTITVTPPGAAARTSAPSYFNVFGLPTITQITPRNFPLSNSTQTPTAIAGTNFVNSGTTLSVTGISPFAANVVNQRSISTGLALSAPGTRLVTVSTTAGASTPGQEIYANGMQGLSDTSAVQGDNFPVNITGCFPDQSQVLDTSNLGGVTFSTATVFNQSTFCAGNSQASASVSVSAAATPGVRSLAVRTPISQGGYTIPTNTVSLTVYAQPTLDGISPAVGARNSTVTVHLHGSGFVRDPVSGLAKVTVTVGGGVGGVSATITNISDLFNMDVAFAINGGATAGFQNVTVTTSDPNNPLTSNALTFNVLGAPTVSANTSLAGYAGGPLYMTFEGTNFLPGGTNVSVSPSTGVTVSNISVNSVFTTLRFQLAISGAATGNRTLTISTTSGVVTRTLTISPTPSAPTLTSITPSSLPENGVLTVTLTGTNFINSGSSVNFSPAGIQSSNWDVGVGATQIATQMTAFVKVGSLGSYTVSVTTAGGTTAAVAFNVVPNLLAGATHLNVSHLAGSTGGAGKVDAAGTNSKFNNPGGLWSDAANLYIADTDNRVIRKVVLATGVTTTIAGLAGAQATVDGVGSLARFNAPGVLWGDGTNLYVSDGPLRKIVLATGAVSLFSAAVNNAQGICGDSTYLYVADTNNHVIQRIALASGVTTVIAGVATVQGFNDGIGTGAHFDNPRGLFCQGVNLYIADYGNNGVRKMDLNTGQVTTLAGNPSFGPTDGTGSPGGAARFYGPRSVWGDGTYLYVTDSLNSKIRKVALNSGFTTTVAGLAGSPGFADGTGGPTGTARFDLPIGIWGALGDLYVSDSNNNGPSASANHAIRKVNISTETVTTFLGGANVSGFLDSSTGILARFSLVSGVYGDGTNVYASDASNNRIRTVAMPNGAVSTLAGTGVGGSQDVPTAQFRNPQGSWSDGKNLYIADSNNATIRKVVLATGATSTLAGTANSSGFLDATGLSAKFNYPTGIWGDGIYLYIADQSNHRIRRLEIATLVVTTFAGSGTLGWQDGTGSVARFNYPNFIWGDGAFLYVADTQNQVIRKIDMVTRVVSTLAGSTGLTGLIDGLQPNVRFNSPYGIWGDQLNLYVADYFNSAIRKIALVTGQVSTIVGGNHGSDDGLDSLAGLTGPFTIWGNASDLYVGEYNSVRRITATTLAQPTLSTITAASGSRGTTMAVTLSGTNFVASATNVSVSGTLVTVSNITVTGNGAILVNFTIDPAAATGARTVTVSTSAGTSAPVTFTVN